MYGYNIYILLSQRVLDIFYVVFKHKQFNLNDLMNNNNNILFACYIIMCGIAVFIPTFLRDCKHITIQNYIFILEPFTM